MPPAVFRLTVLALVLIVARPAYSQARSDTLYVTYDRDGVTRIDSTGSILNRGLRFKPVVVSATRSLRLLEDVPVPTVIVGAEEISELGARRLSDILREQPGLQIVQGHGSASLQMQGLESSYTLILVDGEPVVGRMAGELDLERLSVSAVEQIEVIRGPFSSRYGSDALAGVVNLVTRRPGLEQGGRVSAQYMSHGTSDIAAEAEIGAERWGLRGVVNRYGSSGFSLDPESGSLTIPAFSDYSGEIHAYAEPGEDTRISFRTRLSREDQEGRFFVEDMLFHDDAIRTDVSINPVVNHRFSSQLRGELALYGSRFSNSSETVESAGGALLETDFVHNYRKAEAMLTWLPPARLFLYAGGGVIAETVGGERYPDDRASNQYFGFTELEWMPSRFLDVVISTRFDVPSDYASRLTPKLSLLGKPADWARIRASVGSGYRAPAFRQRYLVFSNAAAGYQLFGAEEVLAELRKLDEIGAIERYLIRPQDLGSLRAENSVAYGFGVEVEPISGLRLKANLFHNEVKDLIDSQVIANLTNGQQIFSYFNLSRVYTQGVESELSWSTGLPGALGDITAGAGYQFLSTGDRDVLDMIDAGRLYRRENGRDVRVSRQDYGGLFGRSRHSGTVSLTHRLDDIGLSTAARLAWRGRYGYADFNGNLVLDHPDEYAPGYAMLNLTITKSFGPADFQVGVRNALDYVDPLVLPHQPGRTLFVGAGYTF